ncbi:hypothetical protein L593_06050 [Salinarchaeum sp. Harcht-Bsk1]|uniref:terminase large subunit domain-containing protein n=1 Tax=Salinarchaeum sp. Harcht-Bsk1 TaxID=1333523 RepID=UPI0003422E53|nr:terminase family protein [Salinarchaeum sp. Harcht-Bsk1]AGN01159.1 hypothetical protein L593_06050 [Salinarchaeum sp. Harcht-Bsk1]
MSETGEDDTAVQRRILRSLWEPHPGQRAIMAHPARFRVVACGRRWGKSEMCAHLALEHALEHPGSTVWWVAPTYDQANEFGFDKVKPLLSTTVLADDPKRTKPREFVLTNGSTVSFRSAEREDSLRGGGVDFLVIDESGSVPDRAWTDELRPALSDTEGDAVFVGTPKGRNWFHQWFQRGQSADHPEVASWQAPTIQNPHVPDEEVEAAREDMPERVFEQEYRAQFVDDTGGVFRNVREQVEDYDLPVAPADCEAPFAIGVDLARLQNWTVAVVLDDRGTVVAFERLQQTTWSRIQQTIEQLAGRYDPATVALDASRDNKIVQDLADAGLATEPVRFTPAKKRTLVENLATALEIDELTLSSDATPLVNELEVYEYEATESGQIRYTAPSGFHDDCVDALALAEWARSNARREPIQVPSTW